MGAVSGLCCQALTAMCAWGEKDIWMSYTENYLQALLAVKSAHTEPHRVLPGGEARLGLAAGGPAGEGTADLNWAHLAPFIVRGQSTGRCQGGGQKRSCREGQQQGEGREQQHFSLKPPHASSCAWAPLEIMEQRKDGRGPGSCMWD